MMFAVYYLIAVVSRMMAEVYCSIMKVCSMMAVIGRMMALVSRMIG